MTWFVAGFTYAGKSAKIILGRSDVAWPLLAVARTGTMKITQRVTEVALLVLLAAAMVGLYLTSGSPKQASSPKSASAPAGAALSINTHYLDTARRLALRAATPEEQQAATTAMDAADRELDLEYAYDLQMAANQPVAETPEIKDTQERIARIRDAVKRHQAEVDDLSSALKRVGRARRAALEQQLEATEAELNLAKEVLGDAKDQLSRAGGDPKSRLDKLKAEHESASKERDTFKFAPLQPQEPSGSVLAKWSRWRTARSKESQIMLARQEALDAAASLSRQQKALEEHISKEGAQQKALAEHDLTPEQIAALVGRHSGSPAAAGKGKAPSREASAPAPQQSPEPNSANASVAVIQHLSTDRTALRVLDRRIELMNSLAAAYGNWGDLVETARRSALHSLIAGGLWIVLMMAVAFFLNRLIGHFFAGLSLERKQKTTLQAVLHICVRLVIVVVILMLIFGKPDNLSTVVGLTGAGLAVALQDFLISFLGWFVLMGRHGIRVGDWVEINANAFSGVRGEVVEITLFRTVLLETGNWNEPGHLTGRQVAFMNMYAVTGYYFNFSTSGQWLWDELQVAIPRSQNPYPLVEKIRRIVAQATESHTHLAESEWQRVSSRYGTKSFSAQPAVNLKPTDTGVIAIVRYITRADERTATRYGLSHEIVKLFHDGEELVSSGAEVVIDSEASPGRP
ncbi:MAG TPA: mechanosensitive ion channel domain-containing protein [Terriglobia bacterium]|nr:mechanosensitive ion channel domain-containing protein [Terriglobia bacterium]